MGHVHLALAPQRGRSMLSSTRVSGARTPTLSGGPAQRRPQPRDARVRSMRVEAPPACRHRRYCVPNSSAWRKPESPPTLRSTQAWPDDLDSEEQLTDTIVNGRSIAVEQLFQLWMSTVQRSGCRARAASWTARRWARIGRSAPTWRACGVTKPMLECRCTWVVPAHEGLDARDGLLDVGEASHGMVRAVLQRPEERLDEGVVVAHRRAAERGRHLVPAEPPRSHEPPSERCWAPRRMSRPLTGTMAPWWQMRASVRSP